MSLSAELRFKVENRRPTDTCRGAWDMDYKLELVLIPVSDVDRAKKFYLQQAGFGLIVDAAIAIAARDIRITMPPSPWCFDGADAIRPLMAEAVAMGEWRLIQVGANRMPAAASYLRRPGDSEFRALKLDVMRIEAGAIAEITTFDAGLFPAFGLSPTL
jgi:hypothetical protein